MNPNIPQHCNGCTKPLLLESLYVDDGCVCSFPRGINFKPQVCTICKVSNCVKPGHRLQSLFGESVGGSVGDRALETKEQRILRHKNALERLDELQFEEVEKVPPTDWSARIVSGESLAPGVANTEDRGDGQQKGYVLLSEEERERGFVRPVRRTYLHLTCKTITTMSQGLAETYAREPKFYSSTFCCTCQKHLPVGKNGQFIWEGTEEKVGT